MTSQDNPISDGLASTAQVLGDKNAAAPFFRFPYFYSASAAEERALQLGLNIWSADVHGSDWTFITAEKVNALVLERLESKKKGILLLHDIHDRTAGLGPGRSFNDIIAFETSKCRSLGPLDCATRMIF